MGSWTVIGWTTACSGSWVDQVELTGDYAKYFAELAVAVCSKIYLSIAWCVNLMFISHFQYIITFSFSSPLYGFLLNGEWHLHRLSL